MAMSIVCGVDGSEQSEAALAVAAGLAERLEAEVVLAYIVEPLQTPSTRATAFGGLTAADPLTTQQQMAAQEEAGVRLLERTAETAGLAGAGLRVEIGLPAERLAEIADDENAELVVVGSRGRGAFKAAFLGSVSTSLVGIARCPVLIVPPGAVGS
jgi:nucleotide-binding universal stress UspA family protein